MSIFAHYFRNKVDYVLYFTHRNEYKRMLGGGKP